MVQKVDLKHFHLQAVLNHCFLGTKKSQQFLKVPISKTTKKNINYFFKSETAYNELLESLNVFLLNNISSFKYYDLEKSENKFIKKT